MGCGHILRTGCRLPGLTFSSSVPERGHSFLSFPDFLWAHRSGNSAPLRPTRLLLSWDLPRCIGHPPRMQTLATPHPVALCRAPNKTGQQEKVKQMSYLIVSWNSLGSGFTRQAFPPLELGLALATPVAKTWDAGGGALRPQWGRWPGSNYWASLVRADTLRMTPSAAFALLPSCPLSVQLDHFCPCHNASSARTRTPRALQAPSKTLLPD
jgi:hypothetical protein